MTGRDGIDRRAVASTDGGSRQGRLITGAAHPTIAPNAHGAFADAATGELPLQWRGVAARAIERDAAVAAGPVVAVLCRPRDARAAACAVALALARSTSRWPALAGAAGITEVSAGLGAMPVARREAARLRADGIAAQETGRLVWLLDEDDEPPGGDVTNAIAFAARLSRAAFALGRPAAIALPLARTAELDRALSRHDALIALRDPDAAEGLLPVALRSLARLGRPVAAMGPLSRPSAALATAGAWPPPEALTAVAALWSGGWRGGAGWVR